MRGRGPVSQERRHVTTTQPPAFEPPSNVPPPHLPTSMFGIALPRRICTVVTPSGRLAVDGPLAPVDRQLPIARSLWPHTIEAGGGEILGKQRSGSDAALEVRGVRRTARATRVLAGGPSRSVLPEKAGRTRNTPRALDCTHGACPVRGRPIPRPLSPPLRSLFYPASA